MLRLWLLTTDPVCAKPDLPEMTLPAPSSHPLSAVPVIRYSIPKKKKKHTKNTHKFKKNSFHLIVHFDKRNEKEKKKNPYFCVDGKMSIFCTFLCSGEIFKFFWNENTGKQDGHFLKWTWKLGVAGEVEW